MGKRAQRKLRQRAVTALAPSERLTVLQRAARLLAEFNAGQPRCVEITATLARCATELSLTAEARAVAVAAQGPQGGCLLGTALADLAPHGVRNIAGYDAAAWDGAGHLVLVCTDGPLLLDPTIDQLRGVTGLPRGALVMPLEPDDLALAELHFGVPGGEILYRHVPTDHSWEPAFNAEFAARGRQARLATRRALELEGYVEDLLPLN